MNEFSYVLINGNRFNIPGYFDEYYNAVIIESDGLIELFSCYKKEEIIINKIVFLNSYEEILKSYSGEYIVDSINRYEVQLYPIK